MADAFARGVRQLVVAQVCDQLGFSAVQRSALDAMADLLGRYIHSLGEKAHGYAELSGRTEANAHDVIMALQDMGTEPDDVIDFTALAEDASGPTSIPVPAFPVRKRQRASTPTFQEAGEAPPRSDVPEWLPVFPDRHTFVTTPVWAQRGSSELDLMAEEGKQKRKAEQCLVRLHNRLEALTAGSQGALMPLWGGMSRSASHPIVQDLHEVDVRTGAPAMVGGEEPGPASAPTLPSSGVLPSVLDAFQDVMRKQPKKSGEEGGGEEGEKQERWGGWASPPTETANAGAEPGAPDAHPGREFLAPARVSFGWGSSLKQKAAAVRCRAAVYSGDVVTSGNGRERGRGREEKRERGKEDEQEETRRKVEGMLREADHVF